MMKSVNVSGSDEMGSGEDAAMVREILFSSRDNINFIHELFRQALCLCFRYAAVMKTVIFTYKDWIQMNVSKTDSCTKAGRKGKACTPFICFITEGDI